MRYQGAKRVCGDAIARVIQQYRGSALIVEPFCGGCNLTERLTGCRVANDMNGYMIAYFKACQNGWMPPPHISKEFFEAVKLDIRSHPPELVGYMATQFSFGGKWFDSYAVEAGEWFNQQCEKSPQLSIDTVNELVQNRWALATHHRLREALEHVRFYNLDYRQLPIPSKAVIYCDPPYADTDQSAYRVTGRFDNNAFWQWVRDSALKGHQIFVSEYSAPDDFSCIWSQDVKVKIGQARARLEQLFVHKSWLREHDTAMFRQ